MKYYVAGFKENDVSLIDKMVKYPLAYIKNGSVIMCDSYPIDPKSLKEKKGWDHSIDRKFELIAANNLEAHAVTSAVRCRADGWKIENVRGYYAFTKTDAGWKMYAVEDATFNHNNLLSPEVPDRPPLCFALEYLVAIMHINVDAAFDTFKAAYE